MTLAQMQGLITFYILVLSTFYMTLLFVFILGNHSARKYIRDISELYSIFRSSQMQLRYKTISWEVLCLWSQWAVIRMEGAMATMSQMSHWKTQWRLCPITLLGHEGRKWSITRQLESCRIEILNKVKMSLTCKNPSRSLQWVSQTTRLLDGSY